MLCSVQAVRQVVYTDALIIGRLYVDGQSFAPIGLHKTDSASDWLLTERLAGSSATKLIGQQQLSGVILAFTGKKMFCFTLKSEGPPKNSKTSRGT
jgi:hypothetical protein